MPELSLISSIISVADPELGANSQSGCANLLFCRFFAKSCMKRIRIRGWGTRPWFPLDLPMHWFLLLCVHFRDGKKIEFRDADNLRLSLLTYKPKVKPGFLAVAPPSLLFYNEVPEATFYNNRWKEREWSGEVRSLDCSTNPPKPGS